MVKTKEVKSECAEILKGLQVHPYLLAKRQIEILANAETSGKKISVKEAAEKADIELREEGKFFGTGKKVAELCKLVGEIE